MAKHICVSTICQGKEVIPTKKGDCPICGSKVDIRKVDTREDV